MARPKEDEDEKEAAKKSSGCGLRRLLCNALFMSCHTSRRRQLPRQRPSSSSSSSSSSSANIKSGSRSGASSRRHRPATTNGVVIVGKHNHHDQTTSRQMIVVPAPWGKENPSVHQAAPSSAKKIKGPPFLQRMQSYGLTSELDSMINDHQRCESSGSQLVRVSSGNVMVYGNLGNLRAPQHARRLAPEQIKEMGNEEYRKGRYAEAAELYGRAIAMNPGVAAYHSNKAAALTGLGRLLDAVDECVRALDVDPSHVRARHRLATLYLRLGEADRAMEQYNRLSSSGGSDAGVEGQHANISRARALQGHLRRCKDARKLKDWRTVIKEAQSAISGAAGADSAPRLFALKAEALHAIRRQEEAERVLASAPGFDVDTSAAFFGAAASAYFLRVKAMVDIAAGRFEDGVTASEMAVSVCPGSKEAAAAARKARAATAARNRGNELFRAGRAEEARAAYGEGLAVDPLNAVLLSNRAACKSKLGRHDSAVDDCTAALELRPSYAKARRRRADCYAKVGRLREAVQDYRVLLEVTSDDEDVVKALAEAEMMIKRTKPA